jgi:glucokinase
MNESLAAAIDIGGTKIAAGIVDAQGRILARGETPTAPELGYPAGRDRTIGLLRSLLIQTGQEIGGIGIGSTGPIDPKTGVYGDVGTLPGWQGFSLAADLEREFRVATTVENDADAAALAEAVWGAGRTSRSLIHVTIGTGIGAGIILERQLYRGAGGAHPEIGHHILDASGPACYCGAHGCWEVLASGPALESFVRAQRGEGLTASQVCDLSRQGDPVCLQAVRREAHYLGLGLANLVTMFCPETITLGGGVMQNADLLLAPALDVVRRMCTQVPARNTSIVLSGLGTQSGLLGAACVWFHQAMAPAA